MITASYTDITGVAKHALIILLAVVAGACAARDGGVPRPRPFPGAALPPVTDDPIARTEPAPPSEPAEPNPSEPSAPAGPDERPVLVRTALGFLGVPYRNGGADPSGFDCSGLMQWVFAHHGIAIPREVREQYKAGTEIDLKDAQPGDLIFFETVSRGASHVGMIVSEGRFVHAPSSRGVVRVEAYVANYWSSRIVGARRMSEAAVSAAGPLRQTARSAR